MKSILKRDSNSVTSVDQRQIFVEESKNLYAKAKEAAEQGDVSASAILILRALDQERRAGGVGPQVMQIIKPRG